MASAFENFVADLARIEDPEKRKTILARAEMAALNATPEEAFEPPIRTLGQYLLDPVEVPPVLVEPYIVVRGGMGCTIGRAGKGKTVMNLNRMLKWSAGSPLFPDWKDHEGNVMLSPTQPMKILIIENEGAGGLFHRQIGIMLNASEYMSDDEKRMAEQNILIWGDGGYSGLKLDDPAKLDNVRRGCEKWEPDMIFIEPFRGLWTGEENSATDMAGVIDALNDIAADYSCGVWISHHERKSGTSEDGEKMSAGRGSTVLEGAMTVMENFESAKGGEERELLWSKSRHAKAPNPVRMTWDPDAWWYKWVPADAMEEGIISALRSNADNPMYVKDLSDALDEPQVKLRGVLKKLEKDGRIKKAGSSQPLEGGKGSTGVPYRLVNSENMSTDGVPARLEI